MGQTAAIVSLTVVFLVTFRAAIAEECIVGDESRWVLANRANAIGNNYTTGADSVIFKVGDYVEFKYKKENHSVLQMNGPAIPDCITSDHPGSWKDSSTSIELNTNRTVWIICRAPGHCEHGQKFRVTVLASSLPVSDGQTQIPRASGPQPGAGKGNIEVLKLCCHHREYHCTSILPPVNSD
ncbi:hypothetical protein MPTK1_4g15680 [Marchantia polymorpha subsp. ruderalis]|uniref:Phytocyanin domain-containing protein n=2 Tax=Marchantia polymorpha TaxID=3197 RepID=A0AAF6BA99_MARPO|nr:hypothetical protein MARPO_0054s0033 [Marchantia polymorpha]BBN08933.1 hypothetical protein Mp_4g15680 [Marchantia polymorpha subsp. ruderalis]|eukprot:PTQ37919.1 hypothetical protein MARPO_0054s0033 [Marchantia polymorpha]